MFVAYGVVKNIFAVIATGLTPCYKMSFLHLL